MGFHSNNIQGKIDGGESRTVGLDSSTHGIANVSYGHHEIHEGNSFEVFATDADLDDSQVLSVAFTTSNTTKWMHMVASGTASKTAMFEIQEAPTITNGTGIDIAIFNRNRNSATTSLATTIEAIPVANTMTLNGTITSPGTILDDVLIGGDTGPGGSSSVGGEARSANELVLAQGTTYVVLITSSANDNRVNLKLNWYEHTDKN